MFLIFLFKTLHLQSDKAFLSNENTLDSHDPVR